MKILFWFHDGVEATRIIHALESAEQFTFKVVNTYQDFQAAFNKMAPHMVFFDLDKDKERVEKINLLIKEKYPQVLRIFTGSDLKPDECKKHQKSPGMAHGYIKRPIDSTFLINLLLDFSKINLLEKEIL